MCTLSEPCMLDHFPVGTLKYPLLQIALVRKDKELLDAPCSRLSIVLFDTGPKRSMGHLLGLEKNNFLIRDIDGPIYSFTI